QKELDEAKAKGTLAGAWVLMPSTGGSFGGWSGDRRPASPKADAPKADAPKSEAPRPDPSFLRALPKELEAAKAAGMIDAAARGDLLHTSGLHRITFDKLPALPAIALLRTQYDEIAGWLRAGKAVSLEFDIRNYFKKGPIKLYNVIADIPGAEKPDEF